MEFSDSDEEIIDLNTDKKKSKDNDKKEKEKSKSKTSSTKNMKWVKSSIECISQMAKSEIEENEYSEFNNENPNIFNEEENDNPKNENIYDNNNNDKDNNDYNNDDNDNIKAFTEQTAETNPDSNSTKKSIYTFTWKEGGNNVKLIGSFSNWKEQYEMEKDENEQIYKFSLPLNNDIYQYKFIVDGVWKCSKEQSTVDDGKGNINNLLDLTNIKPKEDIKKKPSSKKSNKTEKKSKIKGKKKNEQKKSNLNLNKEKKKTFKKREYGNVFPDPMNLTEPNHSDIISKAFNINNESKQKKIGNLKYYKYTANNSYSSIKSYLNTSIYRHTILNHILFLKKIKKNSNIKFGISFRYREKATTIIYYH